MAYARIVVIKTGTVVKNINLTGHATWAVDSAATALSSIICNDRQVLKVEVDYEGCDDSKTIW